MKLALTDHCHIVIHVRGCKFSGGFGFGVYSKDLNLSIARRPCEDDLASLTKPYA